MYESLSEQKTHVTIRTVIETPKLRKPYTVEAEANTILKKPSYMWNREEIMREDLPPNLWLLVFMATRERRKSPSNPLCYFSSQMSTKNTSDNLQYMKDALRMSQRVDLSSSILAFSIAGHLVEGLLELHADFLVL